MGRVWVGSALNSLAACTGCRISTACLIIRSHTTRPPAQHRPDPGNERAHVQLQPGDGDHAIVPLQHPCQLRRAEVPGPPHTQQLVQELRLETTPGLGVEKVD
jgi:hypothetical protein